MQNYRPSENGALPTLSVADSCQRSVGPNNPRTVRDAAKWPITSRARFMAGAAQAPPMGDPQVSRSGTASITLYRLLLVLFPGLFALAKYYTDAYKLPDSSRKLDPMNALVSAGWGCIGFCDGGPSGWRYWLFALDLATLAGSWGVLRILLQRVRSSRPPAAEDIEGGTDAPRQAQEQSVRETPATPCCNDT